MHWRVRRLIDRYLEGYRERYGRVRPEDIQSVKREGRELDLRQVVETVVAESASRRCTRWAGRIELDKRRTVKALGDAKADPRPLPSTRYVTEAEALVGCATPRLGGRLLFAVVRAVKPAAVVEVGTAHGYGALYIGSALRENGAGRLFTLEGMAVRIRMSREAIIRFGLESKVEVVAGDFRQTLPQTLARARPLDLLFSDGAKNPAATWDEFVAALGAMPRGGFMVFDDIGFSPEIASVWERIVREPRVSAAVTFWARWGLLRVGQA